jgi:hypothetical protein
MIFRLYKLKSLYDFRIFDYTWKSAIADTSVESKGAGVVRSGRLSLDFVKLYANKAILEKAVNLL